MAADEAQQEPTMEEILASIRRIISEDDEGSPPANDAEPADSEPEEVLDLSTLVEPEAEPELPEETLDEVEEPEPEADSFEMDDLIAVDDDLPEPELDEPEFAVPEPEEEFTPEPVAKETPSFPLSAGEAESLVETPAATYAATALSKLSGSLQVGTGTTIDELVAELLRPLLKEWLNENLPGIVEAKVEEEVKRISRMAR